MIPYFEINSFNLGPFKIYSWGVFVALAFLVGLILGIRGAKKIRVEPHKITYLIIFVYIGAIISSRLFFVLQWPRDFFSAPLEFFKFTQGGLMLYGGLFGGLAAGWLYLRKLKIPPTPPLLKGGTNSSPPFAKRGMAGILVDALTPIIPLALAIGRLGCFLTNDHLGAETNLLWAIRWPDGTLRHHVALYLILFDLALAGVLWWLSRRHSEERSDEESLAYASRTLPTYAGDSSGGFFAVGKKSAFRMTSWSGHTFLLFLILYPLGRFFLDFTRDASADPHFWGFASSQWISLALLTIILLYAILKYQKDKCISA